MLTLKKIPFLLSDCYLRSVFFFLEYNINFFCDIYHVAKPSIL